METSSDGEPVPFTVHGDKGVMSEVRLASWSPKHEMLAVAFADKPLSLFRLNWQRLWTVSLEADVSALCWSPDGSNLGAGLANGTIVLINVEDAKILHKFKLQQRSGQGEMDTLEQVPSPVVCMGWVQEIDRQNDESISHDQRAIWSTGVMQERLQKFYSPLSPNLPRKPMKIDEIYEKFEKKALPIGGVWDEEPRALTLLVGANNRGWLSMSAFGLMTIAELDTRHFLTKSTSELRTFKVAVTRDLNHLVFLQLMKRRPRADSGHLQAIICDCSILGSHSNEIRQLTLRMSKVTSFLAAAEDALKVADDNWSHAIRTFRLKMEKMPLSYESQTAVDGNIVDELLTFLVSGCLTREMETFFAQELTEHGLKRLADEVDSAIQLINDLMLGHFQVAIEQSLFVVEELLGLTRSHQVLMQNDFGVPESRMKELQIELNWLQLCGEKFRTRVLVVGEQFRLFFSFLLSAIHQINEVPSLAEGAMHKHAMNIAEFLKGEFKNDSIGPQLCVDRPSVSTPNSILLDENEEKLASAILGNRNSTAPLRAHLATLRKWSGWCFDDMKKNLSSKIQLQMQVNLSTYRCRDVTSAGVALGLPQVPAQDFDNKFWIAFPVDAGNLRGHSVTGLVIVKVCLGGGTMNQPSMEAALLRIPHTHTLVDAAFHKGESVLMLLSEAKDFLKGDLIMSNFDSVEFHAVTCSDSRKGIAEVLMDTGKIIDLTDVQGIKQRKHPHPGVCPPLAVSLTDVASVFSTHRVVLYDLAADEDYEMSG